MTMPTLQILQATARQQPQRQQQRQQQRESAPSLSPTILLDLPVSTDGFLTAPAEDWTAVDMALNAGEVTPAYAAAHGILQEQRQARVSSSSSSSSEAAGNDLVWVNGSAFLQGRAEFTDPALPRVRPFDRLPASAQGVVSDGVWQMSRMSTGMCVCACVLAGTATRNGIAGRLVEIAWSHH
jgi:hypothetical protein